MSPPSLSCLCRQPIGFQAPMPARISVGNGLAESPKSGLLGAFGEDAGTLCNELPDACAGICEIELGERIAGDPEPQATARGPWLGPGREAAQRPRALASASLAKRPALAEAELSPSTRASTPCEAHLGSPALQRYTASVLDPVLERALRELLSSMPRDPERCFAEALLAGREGGSPASTSRASAEVLTAEAFARYPSLRPRLCALVQEVLQEMPADPAAFMASRLQRRVVASPRSQRDWSMSASSDEPPCAPQASTETPFFGASAARAWRMPREGSGSPARAPSAAFAITCPKSEVGAGGASGTWLFGDEPRAFEVTRVVGAMRLGVQFRGQARPCSAEAVSGFLAFQDGAFAGQVCNDLSEHAGEVMLRPARDGLCLSFRPPGTTTWGPTAIARRPLQLQALQGRWRIGRLEFAAVALDSEGRARYFGRSWGADFDLHAEQRGMVSVIRRGDGWEVDTQVSGREKLVWFKAGHESLSWRRLPDRRMLMDREEALSEVSVDGLRLQDVAPGLRADRGVVIAAVVQNAQAIRYAARELRADPDVLLMAGLDRRMMLEAGARATQIACISTSSPPLVGKLTDAPWPWQASCEQILVSVRCSPPVGGHSVSSSGLIRAAGACEYVVQRRSGALRQILETFRGGILTSYICSPHALRGGPVVLEVDGGAAYISLERSLGALELLAGESEAAHLYAALFRPGGVERRPLEVAEAARGASVRLLGPAGGCREISVADLASWLLGPLAMSWERGHFAEDLVPFLEGRVAPHFEALSGSRDFALSALRRQGLWLRHLPEALRGNVEVALEAVRQNGLALGDVAEGLEGDARVVRAAIEEDARAWALASKRLRGDAQQGPRLASCEDRLGRTPLLVEAERGDAEGVAALLELRADASQPQRDTGRTPLIAAAAGHPAVVAMLLQAGAAPGSKDQAGETALMVAVRSGLEDAVSALLAAGAEVRTSSREGRTALSVAAEVGGVGGCEGIVGRLIAARADPDHGPAGSTPLMAAAYRGDHRLAAQLLAARADPRSMDQAGQSALSHAARHGHGLVVDELLRGHALADEGDDEGTTALILAARYGHDAVVSRLLRDGADTQCEGHRGFTALSWAAQNGHSAVVSSLLAARADVAHADEDGSTPLALAALSGHSALVEQLLARADPEVQAVPLALQLANGRDIIFMLQKAQHDTAARRQQREVAAAATAGARGTTRR